MENPGVKRCNACAVVKPVDGFSKDKANRDGYQGQCKACNAAHYAANRESVAAYRAMNKEHLAAYQAAYQAKPEVKARVAAYQADYYAKPEVKERRAAYAVAYDAAYYAANKERIAATQATHRKANPEARRNIAQRRRARLAENGAYKVTTEEILRIKASPCVNCNATGNIEVDHIIPVAKGGTESIGNLQPLCGPCNRSKGAKVMRVWQHQRQQHATR